MSGAADAGISPDYGCYDAHDRTVMDRINRHIARVNATMPKATIAEKLERAWAANIKEREDTDSTDEVGRDADYYFAARHTIAADKSAFLKFRDAAIGGVACPTYNGLKILTDMLGIGSVMRTDKDKPNALPGGCEWMGLGADDAMLDRGEDVAAVLPHVFHQQALPAGICFPEGATPPAPDQGQDAGVGLSAGVRP